MALQKDFDAFLSNIEPSATTISYISSIQNSLRDYLKDHSEYKVVHVQTFLSGSYAKHTSIRPKKYDGKRDVDIIVETSYSSTDNSIDVLNELLDTLLEKDLYSSATLHSHSVGIEMDGIEIDVVPVVKSEDDEKYCVGSSEENEWTQSDPKGHIKWSSEINANNNLKYKPLVKMLKWWRRTNCPNDTKYPKGLTLEKIIADNLPDCALNTENHLISTMQAIVSAYQEDYIDKELLPKIADPCINDNNLLEGYSFADFKTFIDKLSEHLILISDNEPTNDTWRQIMGTEFPQDSSTKSSYSLTLISQALSVSHRQKPLWNIPRGAAAVINTQLTYPDGKIVFLENDGPLVPKGCGLTYRALHSIKQPYHIKWQVVNTGNEAAQNTCLRGGFDDSNKGLNCRTESTSYTGKHYVQCFIIKHGSCVAKSKEFIINIE